jgi:polar amino acid transport system substrate-binding protein
LRVELADFAFEGLGAALGLGQVDLAIAAISVTDERQAQMDFSDVYHTGDGVALAKQGAGIGPLSAVADLTPYRVGVQSGSVYQAELRRIVASGAMPADQLSAYDETGEAVADLQRGAIDLFLLDQAPAEEFVAQGGVEIAGQGIHEQRYAIAIPAGAVTLHAELNRALSELANDGTLALLRERYLNAPPAAIAPLAAPTPAAALTPPASTCTEAMAVIEDLSFNDENMHNPPELEKGEPFAKGWRVRNVGTCTWTEAYSLRFVHGTGPEARMSGEPASIDGIVPAGQTVDLFVNLRVPQEPGIHRGFWQLFNARGQAFGETLWAGIAVPTEAPSPTPTATPTPAGTNTPQPTWTPTPPPFVGPNWVLVLIRDESGTPVDPVLGSLITASFASDGTLSGSTGCNTYSGSYKPKESSIKVSDFSFTRLACPTDELNDQENRFLRFIEKATRYEVSGNQLRLFTGENLTVVFQAQ